MPCVAPLVPVPAAAAEGVVCAGTPWEGCAGAPEAPFEPDALVPEDCAADGLTTITGGAACVTGSVPACDCGAAGFCGAAGGTTVAGGTGAAVAGCWKADGGIDWLRAAGWADGGVIAGGGGAVGLVATGAADAMFGKPLALSGNSTRLLAPPSDSST